jgi:ribosomal protein L20A (L18A)
MSKNYAIKGKAKIGLHWEKFEKNVTANNKDRAVEKALSTIGGNHAVKRKQIVIISAEEVKVGGE